MLPAYSKELPPGHVSCSPANRQDGIPSTPSQFWQEPVSDSGQSSHNHRSSRRSSVQLTPNAITGDDSRSRRNSEPSTSDPSPSWPRNGHRARRRISPMPLSSPSQSSMRDTGESQAQAVLQSMNRPRSSRPRGVLPPHSQEDVDTQSGSQTINRGARPAATENLSGAPSREASNNIVQDENSTVCSAGSVRSDPGSTAEAVGGAPNDITEQHVDAVSSEMAALEMSQQRPSPVVIESTTASTAERITCPSVDSPLAPGGSLQTRRRSSHVSRPSRTVRRELFPSESQDSLKNQPAPWHAQMTAVGKRSRSWRSSSSIHDRANHRSRVAHRSKSFCEPNANEMPADSLNTGERAERNAGTRLPALSCSNTEALPSCVSTASPDLQTGPLLRPIRGREPWRLPPLELAQATVPVAVGERPASRSAV